MAFCRYCTGWFSLLGEPHVGDHYTHQPSFSALERSARECPLCALIVQQYDGTDQIKPIKTNAGEGYSTVLQFVGQNTKGVLNEQQNVSWMGLTGLLVFCGEEGRNDDWMCELGLYADEGSSAGQAGIIAGRSVQAHSGSQQSFELMRKWLSRCATVHLPCLPESSLSQPPTTAFSNVLLPRLPTRIIDVGPSTGTQTSFLHLSSMDEVGTYATLSHCWGNSQQFTTTKATLQGRISGIEIGDLPKTMQDAIVITRNLNIRYLWIDSICIIQNDPADWEVESARMAAIYRNAFVNLAATASSYGQKGMLFPREARKTVRIDYMSSGKPHIYSTSISFFISPSKSSLIDPVRMSPLNQRGWVLQERILSRRIIHFSSDQLFWGCQHQFISEDGHYNTTLSPSSYSRLNLDPKLLSVSGPDLPFGHQAYSFDVSILGYWLNLTVEYSRKSLTKDSDVFSALAGIATLVHKRTGDEYVAGMWRSNLHIELLWIAYQAPLKAPSAWRAPSWSWASLVGEISYEGHQTWKTFVPKAEILQAFTDWNGEPFSSCLRSGKLLVRGLVEPASYVAEPTFYHLYDIKTYWLKPFSDPEMRDAYTYRWGVFDQDPPPVQQTIYCLCICTNRDEEHWVLLLERINEQESEYRRIGAGRIDMEHRKFGGGQNKILTIL
ncbi:HET-domain-containing protein [Zopfia rhizophila CBS 207.26]|uniref:HET-domain-containing protein n=1 Tax=Zopfia rhizophila CBS 207.26 TaxID=1314779 RepID=A0A6A6DLB5_9PEZI|nr:HET-domain-containing protein [Zopfia rhizophila CBS 207.26]